MEISATPRASTSRSSTVRTFRLCLGKGKSNKPCAKMVSGESLFCEYHINQEDDFLALQNPIFLDKCDVEIRKLGVQYGITDKRLRIETLKRQILEAMKQTERSKEFKEKQEQRKKLIDYLKVEYNELETEDEKEYYNKVIEKKNFRLAQIQRILDEIVRGESYLVPDDEGQHESLSGNTYRTEYRGSKHKFEPEEKIIRKYVDGDYEYTETKVLRADIKEEIDCLVDEYYQLLKLQFEILNRNIMEKNFKEVLKKWNAELNMKTTSQWASLKQKVDLLLTSGYDLFVEKELFIPDAPYVYLDYCYHTDSFEYINLHMEAFYKEKTLEIRYKRFIDLNAQKKNLNFWFTYKEQLDFARQYFGSRDEALIRWGHRKDSTFKEQSEASLEEQKDSFVHIGNHWFKESLFKNTIEQLKQIKDKSYTSARLRFPDIIYCEEAYNDIMDCLMNSPIKDKPSEPKVKPKVKRSVRTAKGASDFVAVGLRPSCGAHQPPSINLSAPPLAVRATHISSEGLPTDSERGALARAALRRLRSELSLFQSEALNE